MDKCEIFYTGIGATPGGCHTGKQFLLAMKEVDASSKLKHCKSAKDKACVSSWIDWSGALKAKTLPFAQLPKSIKTKVLKLWTQEEINDGTLVGTSDGSIILVSTKFITPEDKALLKYVKKYVA